MRRLDLGEGFAHDAGGGGAVAVEVEGDGEEKAALKEKQLEQSASGTPEAEAHFGLVGLGLSGGPATSAAGLSGPASYEAEPKSVQR